MAEFGPIAFRTKSNLEIEFRHLVPSDAAKLKHFFEQIPYQTDYTLQYVGKPPLPVESWADRIEKYLNGPGHLYLGAFAQGELAASIFFWQNDITHPWIKHIGGFGLMVMKDFWGQGIATELLKHLDSHAKKSGITRIEAEVRADNDVAIQLYEKAGYKFEGRKERASFIDGKYYDCFYIAKNPAS